jgi:replicative DNA helicase
MLEQTVTEKGLPQNAEAERAVLGSILLDPAAISHVVPILAQDDLYSDKHQRIFRGMLDLF